MTDRSHESFEDAAAAYALGALEEHEVAAFEEHLAGCAQCRAEVTTMRKAVSSLGSAAPPASPPVGLRDRVMAEVQNEATAQPTRRPRRVGAPAWLRPGVALGAMAAAAAVALVVVLTTGGGSSTHTFAGIVHAQGASVSLRESSSGAQLRVARLPAPPAHRIYQVWLRRAASAPIPTHALFATTTGSVTLPRNLAGVQEVLVTAEPRPSGSLAPTRAPIIVVHLT
jgi:anti-sigma-K factor RskA